MSETRQVARSAGTVGAATMLSRVLGLVREQVMAGFFGAGLATDAFNVAFRIPNLLRDLFAEGAMSAASLREYAASRSRSGRRQMIQAAQRIRRKFRNSIASPES